MNNEEILGGYRRLKTLRLYSMPSGAIAAGTALCIIFGAGAYRTIGVR